MKAKSILKRFMFFMLALSLLTLILPEVSFAQSNGATVINSYGPPTAANTWEKFTIPLTAATFNVDDVTFQQVMANVQQLRIGTEFHNGYDIGAVDSISIGTRFSSDFNSGLEGWSASGDGTMEWILSGGVSGGHLQVSDWASGDWHYAATPPEWSGNWSDLIGSSLVFYLKTDQPSYASMIEITSEGSNRLVLSADPSIVPLQGSSNVSVSPSPAATQDMAVSLTSSDTNCITIPSSVTIGSGQPSGQFIASAASGAQTDCSSVITASASNYSEGRLTLRVGYDSGQGGLVSTIGQFPDIVFYALACLGLILVGGVLLGAGIFISRRRNRLRMRNTAFRGGSCLLTLVVIGVLAGLVIGGVSLIAFGFIPGQNIQPASAVSINEILITGGGGLLLTLLGAFLLNGGIKAIFSRRTIIEDDWGRLREKRGCSAILSGIAQAFFGVLLLVAGLGMIALTLYKQVLPWLGF